MMSANLSCSRSLRTSSPCFLSRTSVSGCEGWIDIRGCMHKIFYWTFFTMSLNLKSKTDNLVSQISWRDVFERWLSIIVFMIEWISECWMLTLNCRMNVEWVNERNNDWLVVELIMLSRLEISGLYTRETQRV